MANSSRKVKKAELERQAQTEKQKYICMTGSSSFWMTTHLYSVPS